MQSVTSVLKDHRDDIIERWVEAVRAQLANGGEYDSELRDHIPFFIDAMIEMLNDESRGTRKTNLQNYDTVGREHGSQRYRLGFDLKTLVREYGLLRDIILDIMEETQANLSPHEIRLLTNFTFTAIADAVDEHAHQEQLEKQDAQAAEIAALNERNAFEKYLNGIVSHDLRNPLGAIIMTADAHMRRSAADKRAVDSMRRIAQAAKRALRLVETLLDFTRTRLGGTLPVNRQSVSLADIVQQTLDEITQAHPEARFESHSTGNVRGEWDADRLAQVVQNLAANALAYGDPAEPVRLEINGDEPVVRLAVQNIGNPISSDRLAFIFEPMERATRESDTKQSLGLGLYIVWHAVAAHGGKIDVTSTREAGTEFVVHLPRHAATPHT